MLDNRIFEEGASIPLNSAHANKRVRRNTKILYIYMHFLRFALLKKLKKRAKVTIMWTNTKLVQIIAT